MGLAINEQLLNFNRSRQKLVPKGFVIHDTDDPGATAQNEHDYFNSGDRQASAHYFADWTQIIRTIPENEVAWHAGKTANQNYLSIEMCVPKVQDSTKFLEVWQRTVWLVADACLRYGWSTDGHIYSHKDISEKYHETDHQDPIAFLQNYGKSWANLLGAIKTEIINREQQGGLTVDHAVLFFGPDDYVSAKRVAEKYGNCAIFARRQSDGSFNPDALKAKHLVVVGGPAVQHPNVTYLSGHSWFDTIAAVGKFLG
ncbi:MAG: peptidoglycan recognition protein family protein [Desulfitobacteriaceae bacterium]